MFDLINTLAIVTGAAEGNGFAIANGFKQNGAIVLAVDVKKTNYDYIFMTAAVSDYQVKKISKNKIKSKGGSLNLKLYKSTDILQKIANKSSAKIIGFALETENGEYNAKQKMKNKLEHIRFYLCDL